MTFYKFGGVIMRDEYDFSNASKNPYAKNRLLLN